SILPCSSRMSSRFAFLDIHSLAWFGKCRSSVLKKKQHVFFLILLPYKRIMKRLKESLSRTVRFFLKLVRFCLDNGDHHTLWQKFSSIFSKLLVKKSI